MYDIDYDMKVLNAVFTQLARGLASRGIKVLDLRENPKPCIECDCSDKYDDNNDGLLFSDMLDDIDQVIFNDPATIVTFKDGTKVCVKASKNDTFSKETGLVYAIIKRLYANDVDENGYLRSKGLGEKIAKVVANAIDQKKIEADRRAKMRAKAKAKEAKAKEKLANEVSEQAAKEAVEEIYEKKN